MRHGAHIISSMEGMSRPAFRIAHELIQNSRAGLTPRFLARTLDLPEEEIEYLIDVNEGLFFLDLTKVKLVAEGATAVRRVQRGLENHGDVQSLFRLIKALDTSALRQFEEHLGIEDAGGRQAVTETFLEQAYHHPESIVEYVATRDFSPLAQEVFDSLWQSNDGVVPVSVFLSTRDYAEGDIEYALEELIEGFALFEMFRFDSEERLVRNIGLLSELRQWRDEENRVKSRPGSLKPLRAKPSTIDSWDLNLSDRVCRLIAAIAARPARVRGDGELFREDRRRLEAISPDEDAVTLSTCLWIAQGLGWLSQVDNELRAGDTEELIEWSRIDRHCAIHEWIVTHTTEGTAARMLAHTLDAVTSGSWYSVMDFIQFAMHANAENEPPVLKNAGGHWRYVSPSASATAQQVLARFLEGSFLWLGGVERAEINGESVFRLTDLGVTLLTGEGKPALRKQYPNRPAELVIQPNFDIILDTEDVDPLLTVPLDQFAERVSTGPATVYTLSKESFTRAVQEGNDGRAFIEFLLAHNRGGSLPTNVLTTLEDWRGGMKRVRIRTVHVIESEDPLVITDLAHRRKLAKHVSPVDANRTLTYSKISRGELKKLLEKEGFVID